VSEQRGTLLAHTIEADLAGTSRLLWHVLIAPVHDWAVEAMFDRIEEALATGSGATAHKEAYGLCATAAFCVLKKAAALSDLVPTGASSNRTFCTTQVNEKGTRGTWLSRDFVPYFGIPISKMPRNG
jgi:hypothetical protein